MKAFFQAMNFPRFVILASFLASAGLGWYVYDRSAKLAEVQVNLQPERVDAEITKMQNLGMELERYQEKVALSGNSTQQDLPTFIRTTADSPAVGVGQLTVTPMAPKPFGKDSVDLIYKISPKNKTLSYSRTNIANFLYKLEKDNRRVKVTSYDVKPHSGNQRAKAARPGEIFAEDNWTFEAEITLRTKKDAN